MGRRADPRKRDGTYTATRRRRTALISHVFPLQEVARAYELAHSRADGALKVGVRFDGA